MNFKEALEVLNLKEPVEFKSVRIAYLDLVKVWHPDRFTQQPRLAEKANIRTKEINNAYDVIQNHFETKSCTTYQQSWSNEHVVSEKTNENRVYCGVGSCGGFILSNDRCSECGKTLAEGVRIEKAMEQERQAIKSKLLKEERQELKKIFRMVLKLIGIILIIALFKTIYLSMNP